MRVHRLEVTAFGPFATTQVVDFEPLNEAGVFLLTGQTGAGKTSILDAVCFALYGQVPGVRDKAKAYRSHHAPPGVAPRVVLEVTLQSRRFRLTRVAPWARPSSRARSGSVEEKARAVCEELVDGEWVARSSRVDEVGHLVSGLLGLNRDQFCQVVMLPQGDFQAFLRAGGRERQRILESLFATQRFQAVERWLVEHRRAQARWCREHEESLARLVARLQEVSSPVGWLALEEAAEAPDHERLAAGVRSLAESGRSDAVASATTAARADTEAKQSRHALDEARTLAERQARHHDARQRHATLSATAGVVAARDEAIRRARAAAVLTPLTSMVADALAAKAEAAGGVIEAASECRAVPGLAAEGTPPPASAVERAAAALSGRVGRLTALLAVEGLCDRLSVDVEEHRQERDRVAALVADLDAQILADPGVIAEQRSGLAAAERAAMDADRADAEIAASTGALAAAVDLERHDATLARLGAQRLVAREEAVTAAEQWLAARERYLAGIAAELAAALPDDGPCPVCGSTDHPAPARPSTGHVSREQEAELLAVATAARDGLERLDAEVAAVERDRAAALARSGGLDVALATRAAALATQAKAVAEQAAADSEVMRARLDALLRSAEERRARREHAVTDLATVGERLREAEHRLQAERERLTDEVGATTRVADELVRIEQQADACEVLLAAVRSADEADRTARSAVDRLGGALEGSEFEHADDALSAQMTTQDIANAEALNRRYAADLAAVDQALADPVLLAASAEPVPDLELLAAVAERASRAAADAAVAAADLERRQQRLDELAVDLEAGVGALRPLREAKELADDVAGLCTGSSPDNATRTALSHYVLAARLGQVVDAANLRLDTICGGRYRLQHTMTRDAGDSRGGLGLVVADTHTDQPRDPATLSGGETFYVSLSLALGLADVVTQEAGGAELSTLFVDEGFGALDDDTRDEVLDALDALRSGGRTVGLVSHLSELRARFPAQIRVVATRNGSKCVHTGFREAEWTGDEC